MANQDGNLFNKKLFQRASKAEMKSMLKAANLGIKEALYNLSRIIDTGDFHTMLLSERQLSIELFPEIPHCVRKLP